MQQPYTPPAPNSSAFHCPHCSAFAEQQWFRSGLCDLQTNNNRGPVNDFLVNICNHCKKPSYWHKDKMIYPNTVTAPMPNSDLSEDIKKDYEEARQVLNVSPKSSAALLRLVIQKICIHLGEKGKDLNKDISNLVKNGLSTKIQKALDVVRVIGNGSVHRAN